MTSGNQGKSFFGLLARSLARLPLALPAIFLFCGSVAGLPYGHERLWLSLLCVSGLSVLVTALLWRYVGRLRCCSLLFSVLVSLFFFSLGGHSASRSRSDFVPASRHCLVDGTIVRVVKRDSLSVKVVLRADSLVSHDFAAYGVDGILSVPCSLPCGRGDSLRCGNHVSAWVRTSVPKPDRYSDFDYLEYLKTQKLCFLSFADSLSVRESDDFSLASVVGAVGGYFSDSLSSVGVSDANVGFLRALVLADRSELPADVRRSFSVCGTSHVLAVSGLHVGVLSSAAAWLLGLFCSRRRASAFSVVVIWLYAVLTGLSPSVVRASVMFSFLALEVALGRRFPSFHSFWAALFFIVLFDPLSASSVGLWLSFSAVGGLLASVHLFNPWLTRRGIFFRFMCQGVLVSTVAQVATLPVLLCKFHSFPVYFWVNNLVVLEPVKWIFTAALLCPLFCHVPFLGSCAGFVVDSLLSIVEHYCAWASALPCASVEAPRLGLLTFLSLAALVCVAFYFVGHRSPATVRAVFVASALLCVAVCADATRRGGGVAVFNCHGVAGVAVSADGSNSTFFVQRADSALAARAVSDVCASRGWSGAVVDCLSPLCVVECGGRRIAIVSADGVDEVPECDECIVNSRRVPAFRQGVDYVFTENCEAGPSLLRLYKSSH